METIFERAKKIKEKIGKIRNGISRSLEEEIIREYSSFVKWATELILQNYSPFEASVILGKLEKPEKIQDVSEALWWLLERMEKDLKEINARGYSDGEYPLAREWYIEQNKVLDYVFHKNHLWKTDYIAVPTDSGFEKVFYLIPLEKEIEHEIVLRALKEGKIKLK